VYLVRGLQEKVRAKNFQQAGHGLIQLRQHCGRLSLTVECASALCDVKQEFLEGGKTLLGLAQLSETVDTHLIHGLVVNLLRRVGVEHK
jgi:hypothetical protein